VPAGARSSLRLAGEREAGLTRDSRPSSNGRCALDMRFVGLTLTLLNERVSQTSAIATRSQPPKPA